MVSISSVSYLFGGLNGGEESSTTDFACSEESAKKDYGCKTELEVKSVVSSGDRDGCSRFSERRKSGVCEAIFDVQDSEVQKCALNTIHAGILQNFDLQECFTAKAIETQNPDYCNLIEKFSIGYSVYFDCLSQLDYENGLATYDCGQASERCKLMKFLGSISLPHNLSWYSLVYDFLAILIVLTLVFIRLRKTEGDYLQGRSVRLSTIIFFAILVFFIIPQSLIYSGYITSSDVYHLGYGLLWFGYIIGDFRYLLFPIIIFQLSPLILIPTIIITCYILRLINDYFKNKLSSHLYKWFSRITVILLISIYIILGILSAFVVASLATS
jgi:hypothetical protein